MDLLTHPDSDRILGCLMGGAIGDALGAPIEGIPLADIRKRCGPEGLTEYGSERVAAGAITDDTQLTMFTAHALVQASVRQRERGIGGATYGMLQAGYLAWLTSQEKGRRPPPVAGPPGAPPVPGGSLPPGPFAVGGGGWVARNSALVAARGAGKSTIAALRKAEARGRPTWPLGTLEEPISDSKGCGGVMRTAPCGFSLRTAEGSFLLGCKTAALTHGHPTGYLPAGVLAATVFGLVRGAELVPALEEARRWLVQYDGHQETSAALDAAVELAGQGAPTPERLETLGGGWTGEQALAMAVYAALCTTAEVAAYDGAGTSWIGRRGLLLAVNHSGDSDSTGSICGNLLGARYGIAALPEHWQAGLEVRDAVTQMAADCALEFGPNPPVAPGGYGTPSLDWLMRYPEA